MKRIVAGLTLALLATTAFAGPRLPGHKPGFQYLGPATGPSPTFSASRGFFTGRDTGYGINSALGVTNTKFLTYSFWVQGTNDANIGENLLNGSVLQSLASTGCEARASPAGPAFCFSYDNSTNMAQFNSNDSVGTSPSANGLDVAGTGSGALTIGPWNHIIASLNTLTGNCAVYKDGANAVVGGLFTCPSNIAAGIIPDLNNSAGIHFGNLANTNLTSMALSDFWVSEESMVCTGIGAPTTMGTTAVTCAGANTIPPEIIAKFRDPATGKPVELGATGTNPTGRQPELLIKGSGASVANVGSTSAVCCAGGISNGTFFSNSYGLLLPAYGPIGIPTGVPTLLYKNRGNIGSGVTTFSPSPYLGGAAIPTGALAVITTALRDSSGTTDHNITCPGTTSDGGATYVTTAGTVFTRMKSTVEANSSVQAVTCYGLIASGESTSFPVSWTTANTSSATWFMAVYTNVKASSPVGVHAFSTSAASPVVTPTNNTTAANSRVLSIFTDFNAGTVITTVGFGEIRHIVPASGTLPQIVAVDEIVASSGSAMSRSVSNVATWGGQGFQLEILAP